MVDMMSILLCTYVSPVVDKGNCGECRKDRKGKEDKEQKTSCLEGKSKPKGYKFSFSRLSLCSL